MSAYALIGGPFEGWEIFGPFATREEANDWACDHEGHGTGIAFEPESLDEPWQSDADGQFLLMVGRGPFGLRIFGPYQSEARALDLMEVPRMHSAR